MFIRVSQLLAIFFMQLGGMKSAPGRGTRIEEKGCFIREDTIHQPGADSAEVLQFSPTYRI
jgi:hypothetical protein